MILGLAYDLAGFLGFFLVSLLAVGSLLFLLVSLSRRLRAGALSGLVGLAVTLLMALPFLSPRATVVAQTLFLAAVAGADYWCRRALGQSVLLGATVVGTAAIAIAWIGSWLHLSWLMLAPAMAASSALLWAATPQLGRPRIIAFTVATALGSALGVLAGPYGTGAWTLSNRVHDACSGLITEWLGMFTPGLASRWALPGMLAIGGSVTASLWVLRRWHTRAADSRVGTVAALTVLALPASLGGLVAIRFVGVALLVLTPVAAMAAGQIAARTRRRLAEEPRGVFRNARIRFWAHGVHWKPVLIATFVVLLPAIVLMALPLGRPLDEMAVTQRLPQGCRLVSDPASAAPVILLRPDVKVWIDGRADYYGRDRNKEAVRLLGSDDTTSLPLRQATCVILRQEGQFDVGSLMSALDRDPNWTPLAQKGAVRAWVRAPLDPSQ
jgi:hypothetical protein